MPAFFRMHNLLAPILDGITLSLPSHAVRRSMNAALLKLPKHLQARIQSELKPGETVVWAEQPDAGKYMRQGFWLWLFFIPWTAFALFWMAGAAGFQFPNFSRGWDLFPLFGIPFVLIGLGGLSSPYWLRRKAANIVYAITDRRALTLEGSRSYTARTHYPNQLRRVTRKEHPDGSGDLVLEITHYENSDGDARERKNGFFAISHVRKVEQLLEHLAASEK